MFRSKKFSLLMAVVFLFTIMVPFVGSAAAATSIYSLSTKALTAGDDDKDLILVVDMDPAVAESVYGHNAIVKLPSDITVDEVYYELLEGSATVEVEVDGSVISTSSASPTNVPDDNEFKLTIKNSATEQIKIALHMISDVDINADDQLVTADVIRINGDFVDEEDIILGRIGSGEVTVTTGDVPVITESGGEIATIYVKETTPSSLAEKKAIKVKLPKGFEWDTSTVQVEDLASGADIDAEANVLSFGDDNRSFTLNGTTGTLASTAVKSYLEITGEVKVIDKKADFGDIEASLSSDATIDPSSIVVAKYADYVATPKADSVEDVLAGRIGEEIGDILIVEEAPGSLVPQRSITLELPSFAKWNLANTTTDSGDPVVDYDYADFDDPSDFVKRDDGTNIDVAQMYYVDSRTIKCILNDQKSTEAATLKFDNLEVNLEGDAGGKTLTVEVSGSAGVEGEVDVANVIAPVTIETDPVDFKIGFQEQPAGDIVITEGKKGALLEDDLYVRLPGGMYFSETPNVEVEGDLEIGEVKIDLEDNYLVIPIDDQSDEASTITISDIKVSMYRSLPEGEIEVKVGGPAANETYYEDIFEAWTVASEEFGEVITPAPGETKKTASFVVGSTSYTVDGVEQSMDVAPFVESGRTYLPFRYAGLALGVDQILWDGANKTATLMKGNRVVQVTIGSTAMIVNGATVNMDVEPKLVNGRVMLPFRWIATAFGAEVNWDAASKTVTMNLDVAQRN